ncbi:MAG: alpha/beta hydrolase [Hyphomicrobiaceae bacterium]|nr:alpha/beta hydrolase [Hyphomicrobiaceae bacterium]
MPASHHLRRLLIVALTGYLALAGIMFLGQRRLLYNTADGGALADASGLAIPGSERVEIATADGERLAGWYVSPSAAKPVMLFFHGQGGGLPWMTGRWAALRAAGAGVLAISYRGYPGSTGRPSETGLIRDAEAAHAWLRRRHEANLIVIHGLSLGSGVAVALAERVEARALILEAPFSAAVDVAADRYPFLPVRWLMLDTFLSRERIGRIRMPVLIVHGARDTVIPIEHGRRLLARANAPKVFVEIAEGGHTSLVRYGLYEHVWRFIGVHP